MVYWSRRPGGRFNKADLLSKQACLHAPSPESASAGDRTVNCQTAIKQPCGSARVLCRGAGYACMTTVEIVTRHFAHYSEAVWFEGAALMRYAVVIEKVEGNYSAYVPDLPGCVATGAL
ncbi:MAG: hypothetical protein BroJett024_31570 [Alphaproteobacteria bacterium]|nr:MAG: hypothetical protein BroJett024_31570 [Alphaproteobacteria bacterium]